MRRALLWLLPGLALGIPALTWLLPLEDNPLIVRLFGPPQVAPREAWPSHGTATFDHRRLDEVLGRIVGADGWVDYAALAADPSDLDAYLAALGDAPFAALPRDGKLALLINAYNGFTLRLILDHLPLDSIKDIPAADRWRAVHWRLAGHLTSLDALEHDAIRAHFADPRVHFALNCASRGCPPLRAEAYAPDRLDAQLEDQARRVHADPRFVRVEGSTLHLTRLYLWYRGDFEHAAGSAAEFVARWVALPPNAKIVWLPYDWALNGVD